MIIRWNRVWRMAAAMVVATVVVAGALAGAVSAAPSYYLDADLGNDNNSGLSLESPWKTISRLNRVQLVPGARVLFKRGLIWREQLNVNSSGTANEPIIYGAYGDGENPVISGADTVAEWFPFSPKIYQKTFPKSNWPHVSNLVEDQKILARVTWQGMVAVNEANMPKGSFAFNKDSNTIYVRTTDDNAPASHVMTAGRRLYGLLIDKQSHIVIKDITFEQAALHGVFIWRYWVYGGIFH
ncbi:MAG: hypothetical protein WCL49_10975 [bacterium]